MSKLDGEDGNEQLLCKAGGHMVFSHKGHNFVQWTLCKKSATGLDRGRSLSQGDGWFADEKTAWLLKDYIAGIGVVVTASCLWDFRGACRYDGWKMYN